MKPRPPAPLPEKQTLPSPPPVPEESAPAEEKTPVDAEKKEEAADPEEQEIDPDKATAFELVELLELEGVLQPSNGLAILWTRGRMKPGVPPLVLLQVAPSLFEQEILRVIEDLSKKRLRVHAIQTHNNKQIHTRATFLLKKSVGATLRLSHPRSPHTRQRRLFPLMPTDPRPHSHHLAHIQTFLAWAQSITEEQLDGIKKVLSSPQIANLTSLGHIAAALVQTPPSPSPSPSPSPEQAQPSIEQSLAEKIIFNFTQFIVSLTTSQMGDLAHSLSTQQMSDLDNLSSLIAHVGDPLSPQDLRPKIVVERLTLGDKRTPLDPPEGYCLHSVMRDGDRTLAFVFERDDFAARFDRIKAEQAFQGFRQHLIDLGIDVEGILRSSSFYTPPTPPSPPDKEN
jgi:hypothetical protein